MAGLKEHIFLIGFMGCGKSTNAACLAEMTGARQVEMDQMIVENEGMAIADIFKEKGEAYFRELETKLIKSFAGVEPAVISCGGGAVLKEENVRLMKECGKIVLLTAEPGTILCSSMIFPENLPSRQAGNRHFWRGRSFVDLRTTPATGLTARRETHVLLRPDGRRH